MFSCGSGSSSNGTERLVHFQQNAGHDIVGTHLRLLWLIVTHLNCDSRHRRLLPVDSDIWRIFCQVFIRDILEEIRYSAASKFTWWSIPGCCHFGWVKVLKYWCIEMFYNKFCSMFLVRSLRLNYIFGHQLNYIFGHQLNYIFGHQLNYIFGHQLNYIFGHQLNYISVNHDDWN